jgi:hypothetical protein
MADFLNLRDGGGFALRPRETNLCGVARWRAELPRAWRDATVKQFLTRSDPLLDIELSPSQQKRKYSLIGGFLQCFRRSALRASAANLVA